MKITHASTARLADRLETRWILSASSYASVYALIQKYFQPIKYSDHPWTQSIFFNNDSHDLPPEISIKLRRYFKKPVPGAFRPVPGIWHLDEVITDHTQLHQKHKTRTAIDYHAAMKRYRRKNVLCAMTQTDYLCPLNTPLRPYTAIEYHRDHFTNKAGDCRITLDRDIRFWHQLAEGTWIPLGQEYGIRFEIKCLPSVLSSALWKTLRALLVRNRALPIGGKRYAALNRLSAWQRTIMPLPQNEAPGVEYGASFEVKTGTAYALSAELYQLFTRTPRFAITSDRPWISEGGLIRIYFKDQFRINLYGDTFRWVWSPSLRSPISTSLIRRQRQEKSGYRLITPPLIREYFSTHAFHGALLQGRRQFWVEGQDRRVFQISIFRSTNFSSSSQLNQVDIQYVGRAIPADPQNPEKKIECQLRTLARLVKSHCGELTPARRSLFAFAAMEDQDMSNPVPQVLSRIGKDRISERAKATR
ncbi:hypothetical protein A3J43_03895 [Candidatus Uhrbacteria bacterium RIFCSPHIGHO2_12_FULL_54_23]|uniref:VTC domain-containing protein n=1 Tax=Candidatus Uhrbacteria bacterium RIFCSPHIGHO2_12_FULL_54_23 TaxID=1802397 RepID=A0A1F7UJN1_9BACT|nr:MAG: hypothetical protein A3J43_03895 [Candidatus Uhrbacteria bacterium RIFCSPHIGHO2_12_FULL_54_23]